MNTQLKELILSEKLIAICRGVEASKCMKVAEALYNGGFRLMEITFDLKHPDSWQVTAESIAAVAREYRGRMEVGAGTVVSVELVELAAGAGARFIISPDTNPAVIRRTKELGLISMPGALSPSEAMAAHEAGADFVKLFPISDLGVSYVKAIRAPLSHIDFMAVGGINADNLASYLKAGCVGAGIGGCLVNKNWVESGEFEKITSTAMDMVRIAGSCGG